jgi:hypothetical protein
MRTLKQEEVYGTDYRDLNDARNRIGQFLDEVYNRQRLHSALRYLTPEEFERNSQARGSDGADGSDGKPKNGLPPLPLALEIPTGVPHSRFSDERLIWKSSHRSMASAARRFFSDAGISLALSQAPFSRSSLTPSGCPEHLSGFGGAKPSDNVNSEACGFPSQP